MRLHRGSSLLTFIFFLFILTITFSMPHYSFRDKRSGISDQRLAELETLINLAKQKNRGRPPIAFGVIDPLKVGKRKRSNDVTEMDDLRELFDDPLKEKEYAENARFWDLMTDLRRYTN
ncbi:uncharacterized protein [Centruroides vittatus]|uniref:uncharacterized protein LOC111629712 n=1 Tax=Centruroides sculpturatus TaxID=218467 RepID=UPI000C6CF0F0|nr:uncharacterized protein LOC111629712 [Centruroides sculpturatus]